MNIFDTVVLGIVEGLTEFLPISSTGHMIVVGNWLSVAQSDTNMAFEVIIQLAAILAVISNYREKFSFKYSALWGKVFLSFLPIGAVGFLFSHQVKEFFSVPVVGTMFIVGGIVFLIIEYFYKEEKSHVNDVDAITFKQAFWIGIAQVFALIPGTSRAGSSIVGALCVGLTRKASAEFSFLLALPVLGAAASYDLLKHYKDFSENDLLSLFLGFVTAFIIAYLSIKLFLSFLQKFTFVGFGLYRIAFGALLLGLAW